MLYNLDVQYLLIQMLNLVTKDKETGEPKDTAWNAAIRECMSVLIEYQKEHDLKEIERIKQQTRCNCMEKPDYAL